jgi:RNA polymerase sigma-70 factor (ECF subfamily)
MQDHPVNTELFVQLAAGDEHAFRQVFHYYTPRLQPFVFSIVKSAAISEEIVQDVFMKLWINRHDVAAKDNPASWLFTVAANQSLGFLRRMSVERRYINKVKLQIQEAWEQSPTEDQLFFKEHEALFKQAIEILPPQQKLIYTLSRQEGFSHKEIADQLNISPSTVKNQIVTAVRTLREFIRKAGIIFLIFFVS